MTLHPAANLMHALGIIVIYFYRVIPDEEFILSMTLEW